MTDEETGVTPVAQDGEPSDDLARARQRRNGGGRRASARASAARDGGSVADRAAGEEPPTDEELFPMGSLDGDPKITLRSLIRAGQPIEEVTVSMMAAEVPSRTNGLLDPNERHRVVVTCEWANAVPVPIRREVGGVKKIVAWKIRQVLRPTYVELLDDAMAPPAAAGA